MDARTKAWVDRHNAHITQTIRRDGLYIQYVGGEECVNPACPTDAPDELPFAYTVGLFGIGHPELLLLGVSPQMAVDVFLHLGNHILAGDHLIPGQLVDLGDYTIIPEEVPNPGDIVFTANDFYQRPDRFSVPVLQLTYADSRGRFPWDEGCDFAERQPRPGTFTA